MGEIKADTIVTMHVIIRPVAAGKMQGEPALIRSGTRIVMQGHPGCIFPAADNIKAPKYRLT